MDVANSWICHRRPDRRNWAFGETGALLSFELFVLGETILISCFTNPPNLIFEYWKKVKFPSEDQIYFPACNSLKCTYLSSIIEWYDRKLCVWRRINSFTCAWRIYIMDCYNDIHVQNIELHSMLLEFCFY